MTNNEWQDIATAPKDGTKIILLFTSGMIDIAFWEDAEGDNDISCWVDKNYIDYVDKYIVGWILLPRLPKGES